VTCLCREYMNRIMASRCDCGPWPRERGFRGSSGNSGKLRWGLYRNRLSIEYVGVETCGADGRSRTMPQEDCRNRGTDRGWPTGRTRPLSGAGGLVGGATNHRAGDLRREVKARRDRSWGGHKGMLKVSAADRVNALAVLALCGYDREPHLLTQAAADEAANAVGLPVSCLHDFGKRGSVRSFQ